MGKSCAKCGGRNHFARKCFTRDERSERNEQTGNRFKRTYNKAQSSDTNTKIEPAEKKKYEEKDSTVQMIENNDYDDVFCV